MSVQERVKRLQKNLKKLQLDAYLVVDTKNILYFTGVELTCAHLLITPKSVQLFVNAMTAQECESITHMKIFVKPLQTSQLLRQERKRIGVESTLSLSEYQALKKVLRPHTLLARDLVRSIRMVKDKKEITILRANAKSLYETYCHLKSWIREGMSEWDVVIEFEHYLRQKGASQSAFPPIIAFGQGAAIPHYRPSKDITLKRNMPILMDIGLTARGYQSDMTRVFAVDQLPSPIDTLYRIVKEAHDEALSACEVGVLVQELDAIARRVLKRYGYDKHFIHSLGHGIGICVHEEPFLRFKTTSHQVLQEGMVFTIEPGIYLPGVGGVRYENMIVIEQGKGKRLF